MADFKERFGSKKQQWTTPEKLWRPLNDEFHFITDLAADKDNSKCPSFFDAETDGLRQEWKGVCWLNPPYGDQKSKLSHWIKKAYLSAAVGGATVVMLIPARTNTKWWRDFCMKAAEVRFICGRPKFGDADHGLPLPLAVVVFRKFDGETKFSTMAV